MTAQIIDGKAIAAKTRANISAEVASMVADGQRAPGLAVVLVGDDPASAVYVRNKQRACEEVGVYSVEHRLSAETTQSQLLALIDSLNHDSSIDGILVQLPLPKQIDPDTVIEHISPAKDVDGFHPYNIGRLVQKKPTLRPCTPYGCIKLLQSTGESLAGKKAVIIGQSNIVGRPMFLELLLEATTPTVCHSRTMDLQNEVATADIVVAAIGKPNFVPGAWIKPGAMVIDVGINRLDDGSLCGDVDYASASERAGWITPVPGGVGPMTIAMLLKNTLTAYRNR